MHVVFYELETDGPLIAGRTVLTCLRYQPKKAEIIRDRDWFCQCNSQLFLANGFLPVFFEPCGAVHMKGTIDAELRRHNERTNERTRNEDEESKQNFLKYNSAGGRERGRN